MLERVNLLACACVSAWVYVGHTACQISRYQLMWKRALKKGIVLQLRQMLLLLSAFTFNLFFKPLEYPIYRAKIK